MLSAAFVYVRKGGAVPPLSPLYRGLYKVLFSGPKVFRLQVGEWEESVSIDRLKSHRGPLQSSQRSRRQGAGRRLADFFLILYPRVSSWPGVL